MKQLVSFLAFLMLLTTACQENAIFKAKPNYEALKAYSETGHVQVVVEIPAGSNHKIEYNKSSHKFENDKINGKTRIIDFLPYPGNYGFIPGTYMDPKKGGDGDALDVLVIGESQKTGTVMEVIPIAAMLLIDNDELDTKLIAVPADSTLQVMQVADFQTFMITHHAARKILEDWFLNYKGFGAMQLAGWRDENYAQEEIKKWLIDEAK